MVAELLILGDNVVPYRQAYKLACMSCMFLSILADRFCLPTIQLSSGDEMTSCPKLFFTLQFNGDT
jgi:hypothetical protein